MANENENKFNWLKNNALHLATVCIFCVTVIYQFGILADKIDQMQEILKNGTVEKIQSQQINDIRDIRKLQNNQKYYNYYFSHKKDTKNER